MNKGIYCEWVDSKFLYGWEHPDCLSGEPTIVHSLGFLVEEDDVKVIITSAVSNATQNVGNPIIIPKSAITKRREVSL